MSRITEADDRLSAERPLQCKVCMALRTLPEDEAGDLRALLPERSGGHIARLLRDEFGIVVGKSSVNNHKATHV